MIKHICILLLLLSSTVYSQSISPLIPYLTNNQLLSRPKVLRKMQEEITKNRDVETGLKINDLSKYFDDLKERVRKFSTFKIECDTITKKYSFITFYDPNKKINIEEFISDNNISIDTCIKNSTSESLNRYLDSLIIKLNPYARGILVNGLLIVFDNNKESNYTINLNDISTEYYAINLKKLTDALTKYIFVKMENNKIINPKNLNDSITFVSRVNKIFGNVDEEIKDKIITKINTIQDFLENDLKDISNWLLSGNMGLGISKSEGEFTGGIQISYNCSNTFQGGIFVNNNFKDQSDSLNIKPASLIGIQGRYATDYIQADGLISGYFGNANFGAFRNLEFGIGLSTKISSIIVGLSYYNLLSKAKDAANFSTNAQNLGLYVKTSSRQSPTLYLGVIRDKGEWGGVAAKIIYPINAL